jgi:transcriptional regulator with XRE-family HTH domain
MAVEANIGVSTVNNWFGRNSTPKIEAIESLCVAFGITTSAFFNESDDVDYLTVEQRELLSEWTCLHKNEKADILRLIKTINANRKNNPY